MNKETIVIKTNIKGILSALLKKLVVVLAVLFFLVISNKVKIYAAKKYNITDSIFGGEILGTISMVLIYIVMGIIFILFLIALYRFLILFYQLKRITTLDFEKEKIVVETYDFPFEKEILEKRFNRIAGVEINQKTIDRAVNCGTLYIEYLVLSKNDSKLRGIEVPYVENPIEIKNKLLEE